MTDRVDIKRDEKAYNTTSENPNKYEEDYDPQKDNRKYIVYRNDIKYRVKKDIDPNRAIFADKDVMDDYFNCDTDGLDYRIKECHLQKDEVLDLSHMHEDVFSDLYGHQDFDTVRKTIVLITANESDISWLPDLRVFPNLLSIDLSGNCLKELPEFPDSLEELIIDDNQVTTIRCIPNLLRLRAKNNCLEEIDYTDLLESMSLSDNPLLKKLAQLNNLYFLEINNTGIIDIPACNNLKYLDMDNTSVTSLPRMDKLAILSCSRSKLSDISNLTSLSCLISPDSGIRQVHYMPTLQSFSFNGVYKAEIRLSSRYNAKRVFSNKNNIIEMIFKDYLAPTKILNS